jgi:hypothetical protein
MVAVSEWVSPTRMTGLLAYTASFLACAARWANYRKNRVSDRPFALLAMVQFCLLLDMFFDWRWKLHDFWMQEATLLGVYDQRRTTQVLAIGLLSLAAVFATVSILVRFRRRVGFALAFTSTLWSVGLWCSEWVSLHQLDGVFYHMVGQVMMVSLFWAGFALVACLGAWLDGRAALSG